jgi:hypothetical protein
MQNFWQQPIVIATYRALIGATVMAGVGFFAVLQQHGPTVDAEIAAGAAFFGYLALRAGVEGLIDQAKA